MLLYNLALFIKASDIRKNPKRKVVGNLLFFHLLKDVGQGLSYNKLSDEGNWK